MADGDKNRKHKKLLRKIAQMEKCLALKKRLRHEAGYAPTAPNQELIQERSPDNHLEVEGTSVGEKSDVNENEHNLRVSPNGASGDEAVGIGLKDDGLKFVFSDDEGSDNSFILPTQPEVAEVSRKSKLKRFSDKLKRRRTPHSKLTLYDARSEPSCDKTAEDAVSENDKSIFESDNFPDQFFSFKLPRLNLQKIFSNKSEFSLPKDYTSLKLEHLRTQAVLSGGFSQAPKRQRKNSNNKSFLQISFQEAEASSNFDPSALSSSEGICDVVPSSQVPVGQHRKRKRRGRGNGWSSKRKKPKKVEPERPAQDSDDLFATSEIETKTATCSGNQPELEVELIERPPTPIFEHSPRAEPSFLTTKKENLEAEDYATEQEDFIFSSQSSLAAKSHRRLSRTKRISAENGSEFPASQFKHVNCDIVNCSDYNSKYLNDVTSKDIHDIANDIDEVTNEDAILVTSGKAPDVQAEYEDVKNERACDFTREDPQDVTIGDDDVTQDVAIDDAHDDVILSQSILQSSTRRISTLVKATTLDDPSSVGDDVILEETVTSERNVVVDYIVKASSHAAQKSDLIEESVFQEERTSGRLNFADPECHAESLEKVKSDVFEISSVQEKDDKVSNVHPTSIGRAAEAKNLFEDIDLDWFEDDFQIAATQKKCLKSCDAAKSANSQLFPTTDTLDLMDFDTMELVMKEKSESLDVNLRSHFKKPPDVLQVHISDGQEQFVICLVQKNFVKFFGMSRLENRIKWTRNFDRRISDRVEAQTVFLSSQNSNFCCLKSYTLEKSKGMLMLNESSYGVMVNPITFQLEDFVFKSLKILHEPRAFGHLRVIGMTESRVLISYYLPSRGFSRLHLLHYEHDRQQQVLAQHLASLPFRIDQLLAVQGFEGHFVTISDGSVVTVSQFSIQLSETKLAKLTQVRKAKILDPSLGSRIVSLHGEKNDDVSFVLFDNDGEVNLFENLFSLTGRGNILARKKLNDQTKFVDCVLGNTFIALSRNHFVSVFKMSDASLVGWNIIF